MKFTKEQINSFPRDASIALALDILAIIFNMRALANAGCILESHCSLGFFSIIFTPGFFINPNYPAWFSPLGLGLNAIYYFVLIKIIIYLYKKYRA